MAKAITIIQGHPDRDDARLCRALAEAYRGGALAAGHDVDTVDVAALDFALLKSKAEFESPELADSIRAAQRKIEKAEHLLIIYPLWLGAMPALLKGFLEQTFRPGFAFAYKEKGLPEKKLRGRSARVVVTMGMPALAYRFFFGAHSLKSFERNILKFVGISPVRETLFGLVEAASEQKRRSWLDKMEKLGRQGR